MAPSIGQAISFISSATCATSLANDTSGTEHIIPTIWQNTKTRTMNRMVAWTRIIK